MTMYEIIVCFSKEKDTWRMIILYVESFIYIYIFYSFVQKNKLINDENIDHN